MEDSQTSQSSALSLYQYISKTRARCLTIARRTRDLGQWGGARAGNTRAPQPHRALYECAGVGVDISLPGGGPYGQRLRWAHACDLATLRTSLRRGAWELHHASKAGIMVA